MILLILQGINMLTMAKIITIYLVSILFRKLGA